MGKPCTAYRHPQSGLRLSEQHGLTVMYAENAAYHLHDECLGAGTFAVMRNSPRFALYIFVKVECCTSQAYELDRALGKLLLKPHS
jgi:hypothetical protein